MNGKKLFVSKSSDMSHKQKNKKHGKSDITSGDDSAHEQSEAMEIDRLKSRVVDEAPASGFQGSSREDLMFSTMPISSRTLQGLAAAKLISPTDIQAAAIPHALAGRDILGAAKTGSGKTLAFCIPIIERLYTERWGLEDGLAAIIITPTRELALQIFEVIRIVGKKHQLSAGLVTGGKKEFEGEQERIVRMNILVATPGRLLQHFQQSTGFDASQLMMLVLDEADRILDMGFKQELDSILEYLPPHQTLLFSATQTKSIKDLARLSLRSPEYLAVHSADKEVTPAKLIQNYIICKLHEKLDVLFSFIKSHLKSKLIVFFSTCAQVRYVHECFRGMQPGIPLTALHGKIKQERRTLIYMDFTRRSSACMLCTDIAARGLDFPDVDWVIQVDAPEDSAMYIHRVGRTARYTSSGRALLMLMPHEEKQVIKPLEERGVPISKLTINTKFTVSVAARAAALLVSQPECKILAKKAFTGYLRSLQLLPDREPIDPNTLPTQEFSVALGLPFSPPVPIISRVTASSTSSSSAVTASSVSADGEATRDAVREKKNVNRQLDKLKRQIKEAKAAKKLARELAASGVSPITGNEKNACKDDDEEEDLFAPATVTLDKRKRSLSEDDKPEQAADHEEEEELMNEAALSRKDKKNKTKKLKIRKDGEATSADGKKVLFDEQGDAVQPLQLLVREKQLAHGGADTNGKTTKDGVTEHAQAVRARIDQTRAEDELREKSRIKEKHKEVKMREKAKRKGDDDKLVTLGGASATTHSDDDDDDDDEEDQQDVFGDDSNSDYDEDEEDDEQDNSAKLAQQEALVLSMMKKQNKK